MALLNTDPVALLQRYRLKGLLLDANLLLLHVIGSCDVGLIGREKLSQYTSEDFIILRAFVNTFSKLVTTAHILTEVSNLLGKSLGGKHRSLCYKAFAESIFMMQEEHQRSKDAAQRAEFHFLGLTDCAIANLAGHFFVLSTDALLVVKLQEAGLEAVNFNHYRDHLQRLV